MKYSIVNTKNQAIKLAKEIIKSNSNCKRLHSSFVRNLSLRCNCGETQAVEITGQFKNKWLTAIVGICKHCNNQ